MRSVRRRRVHMGWCAWVFPGGLRAHLHGVVRDEDGEVRHRQDEVRRLLVQRERAHVQALVRDNHTGPHPADSVGGEGHSPWHDVQVRPVVQHVHENHGKVAVVRDLPAVAISEKVVRGRRSRQK